MSLTRIVIAIGMLFHVMWMGRAVRALEEANYYLKEISAAQRTLASPPK